MATQPTEYDPSAVSNELLRILASREFENSARMRSLLEYIVQATLEGRTADLKESIIGVQVFGREAGYDPKIDAIVRVEARRLRTKLAEYYAGAGAVDPVRIELPKGSYVAEFRSVAASPPAAAIEAPQPEPVSAPPSRSRWAVWPWLTAAAFLTLSGFVWFARREPPREPAAAQPFSSLPGLERKPAFSPDGKTLAFYYVPPGAGNASIFVQGADEHSPRQLTRPPENMSDVAPAWSPRGDALAFFRFGKDSPAVLMLVPARGGEPRKIVQLTARYSTELNITWSAEGAFIITSNRTKVTQEPSLIKVSVASGEVIPLTSGAETGGDFFPEISPDRKLISWVRVRGRDLNDLCVAPWQSDRQEMGSCTQLTPRPSFLDSLTWSADSKDIIFSTDLSGAPRLWRVSRDGGRLVLIQEAGADALTPSASPTDSRLAWVQRHRDINIWRVSSGGRDNKPLTGSSLVDESPDFAPDGRQLAFSSNRSGNYEIWISNADGSSAKRLTFTESGAARSPKWSPDARWIVYEGSKNGNSDIYVIAASGGTPRRLTIAATAETMPNWSRDGKWIYYVSQREEAQIFKQPAAGGDEIRATRIGGYGPAESKDGKWLYFTAGGADKGLWRAAVGGGVEELVYPNLEAYSWGSWALAHNGLYHLHFDRNVSPTGTIMFLDFATRKERPVASLSGHPALWVWSFALSPDERTLLYSQLDHENTDILMLHDWK